MEAFGAEAVRSVQACLRHVEESDALIAIVAHRYGWVPPVEEGGDGAKSITALEIQCALERGIPVFGFLVEGEFGWTGPREQDELTSREVRNDPVRFAQVEARLDGLEDLRALLRQRPCDSFTSPESLAACVSTVLAQWRDGKGGIRTDEDEAAPLVRYRRWLVGAHSARIPFFEQIGIPGDEAIVQIGVEPHPTRDPRHGLEPGRGSVRCTLRELLERPDSRTGRWVLRGAPGAGKSTLCRELVDRLGAEAEGPLPVLVPLASWASEPGGVDPFSLVAAEAEEEPGARSTLAEALRKAASEDAGRVWILLDGLDEVPGSKRGAVEQRIVNLAHDYRGARLLVTTRPEAYNPSRLPGLDEARLLELQPKEQEQLLEAWLGADLADKAQALLAHRRRLAELASNPLLLTLLAKLVQTAHEPEEGAELWGLPADLPFNRTGLYDRAIELLLRRGHGQLVRRGVRDSVAARALLVPLALQLSLDERESWSPDELTANVWHLIRADEELAGYVRLAWDTPQAFVEDVAQSSGIFGLHDGPGTPWRFLHRSLRDYLAAVAIAAGRVPAEGDEAEWLVSRLKEDDETGRWGEIVALLVGLLGNDDPRRARLLEALVSSSHELATRTLPQLEGLGIDEALGLLDRVAADEYGQGWDGEDLRLLLESLLLENHPHDAVREAVLERVQVDASTEGLAHLLYGLERSGVGIERQRFFRLCARWPRAGEPSAPTSVRIPAEGSSVTFVMGSPEDEPERYEDEALHEVTLSPFALTTTPVTEGEYALFDASRPAEHPNHPVRDVTWWSAWLYCRWLGGELPTEAQWECACRAGTTTRFWSGDGEEDLARIGCFGGNLNGPAREVGQKPANPWGLHDMHGLVLEWCSDWLGAYPSDPQENPKGAATGDQRVLRGGYAWDYAGRCRSACRSADVPGYAYVSVGFRVALPAGG